MPHSYSGWNRQRRPDAKLFNVHNPQSRSPSDGSSEDQLDPQSGITGLDEMDLHAFVDNLLGNDTGMLGSGEQPLAPPDSGVDLAAISQRLAATLCGGDGAAAAASRGYDASRSPMGGASGFAPVTPGLAQATICTWTL